MEGVVAVAAALAAESVALLGFGVDSFVESISGAVLIWRLRAEATSSNPEHVETVERRAQVLVAASLFLLAGYIAIDASMALVNHEKPRSSVVGVVLTAVSIGVMLWLAAAKRRTGAALGSKALQADAAQTKACWWLSIIVLVGLVLNVRWDGGGLIPSQPSASWRFSFAKAKRHGKAKTAVELVCSVAVGAGVSAGPSRASR